MKTRKFQINKNKKQIQRNKNKNSTKRRKKPLTGGASKHKAEVPQKKRTQNIVV